MEVIVFWPSDPSVVDLSSTDAMILVINLVDVITLLPFGTWNSVVVTIVLVTLWPLVLVTTVTVVTGTAVVVNKLTVDVIVLVTTCVT